MKQLIISSFLSAASLIAACASVQAQTATFSYFKYQGNDERFHKNIDANTQFLNPILAGFRPDPSVCRVGNTYYLVNSSFAFFPGVPLYESADLVHWKQQGYVLDRPSQLPLYETGVSGGIFAPDIKYNAKNKTFYMITTNVAAGNFFVKTKDPSKGWSEPVYLKQVDGIDPSFFFDKDGSAYIVHNGPVEGGADYEGQRAIRIMKFDTKGDSIITRGTPGNRGWWQIVRGGTHVSKRPIWIEGPHLYRIGKYYYLMCAEGGTGDAHSEVIFRAPLRADLTKADSWEECPHNPILTQRDLYNYAENPYLPVDAVTSTGHADLVQTPQGDWYAVFLGCRPYNGPYYNTGRDTYLLPVTWKDGWPTILPKGKALPTVGVTPRTSRKEMSQTQNTQVPWTGNFSYTDRFDGQKLDMRWMFLRNPTTTFYQLTGKGLAINSMPVSISQRKSPAAIFTRQQHTDFTAETELTYKPQQANDLAGITLLQNEAYNFVYGITLLDGKPALTLVRSDKTPALIASCFLKDGVQGGNVQVKLRIEGRGRYYNFYYATNGGQWQPLAMGVDAINLSTCKSGGFIGTCIGLYATSANGMPVK